MEKNLIIFMIFFTPFIAHAKPEASLKKCQYWKDKVEGYTELRRDGGSSKQMEKWRKNRRKYAELFRDNSCDDWGRKIK